MTIICSICQDGITERPQNLNTDDDLIIRALKCGHVFHQTCIKEWFESGQGDTPSIQRMHVTFGRCPCCKNPGLLTEGLRLFPTSDDDLNTMADLESSLRDLRVANECLETKLEDIGVESISWKTRYEKEVEEHELLKLQHAETLSCMQLLQDQIDEFNEIRDTLENSVKTAIEKIEKDRKEDNMLIIL